MSIDTQFLRHHTDILEYALGELNLTGPDEVSHDMYGAACLKEFETVLEQSGRLLRKILGGYLADNRQADRLVFKDLFRHAAKHDLIDSKASERWLSYRDNLNSITHDCGEVLAESTLELLPSFIADARTLDRAIQTEGAHSP